MTCERCGRRSRGRLCRDCQRNKRREAELGPVGGTKDDEEEDDE